MLSDEIKLAGRRVLRSSIRAYIYREKVRLDSAYECWSFMADLEVTHLQEWHKSLAEQSVAQDEATAYLAEVLDGILEDIQVDFKAFGVSVGEEVASYRATFQPLNLMPKGAVH